jgi:parallel beta-helix repeat protein
MNFSDFSLINAVIGLSGNAYEQWSMAGLLTTPPLINPSITFFGNFETGLMYGAGNTNWFDAPILTGTATAETISDGSGGYFAKFTIPADQGTILAGAHAEASTMQDSSNNPIYESVASGIQIYAFKTKFDATWQAMSNNFSNGRWAIFAECQGPSYLNSNPAWALDANGMILSIRGGDNDLNSGIDYLMSDTSLPLDEWIDWRVTVRYGLTDSTGAIKVERKNTGASNFTTVANLPNIATLQYRASMNGGAVDDHNVRIGLYRSYEAFTSIIYHDGFTRETSGESLLHGDITINESATGALAVEVFLSGLMSEINTMEGSTDSIPIRGAMFESASATGRVNTAIAIAGAMLERVTDVATLNIVFNTAPIFYGNFDTGLVTGTGNRNWVGYHSSAGANALIQSDGVGGYWAKFTVPSSGSANSERSEVVNMQSNTGIIYENEASGTKIYRFRTKFDTTWQAMNNTGGNGDWAIFMQLHCPDPFPWNPTWALDAHGMMVSIKGGNIDINSGQDFPMSDSSLRLGEWIDWIVTVKYGKTNSTGALKVERKNLGAASYTTVFNNPNIATLAYSNANPTVGNHYMKLGLYRNYQSFTSIIYHDGFTAEIAQSAPNISAITKTAVSSTAIDIGWSLDVPGTGQIEYGTTTAYGTLSTKENNLLYAHVQRISGLTAGALYHFRIHSINGNGIESISTDQTFSLSSTTTAVPNIVGMTGTAANTAITNVGLAVGTVTGSSGNVTVQSPVAGTIVNVGTLVNYTIAVAVNVRNSPYNAVGNGIANDTAAIQAAINAVAGTNGTVFVPDGTYMIDAVTNNGLNMGSNMTLQMSSGATLKAITNAVSQYSVIICDVGKTNINITGGTVQGERTTHTGSGGEWGFGIRLNGCSNVAITGTTAKDCWGDGFYLGGNATNTNLQSVTASNNRRQGISIVRATGCLIENSVFITTVGTSPQAGIDIEPNAGEVVSNVTINNNQFYSNTGTGILLWGEQGSTNTINTIITNNIVHNNAFGIYLYNTSGHTITGNTVYSNNSYGIAMQLNSNNNTVSNNTVYSNGNYGIRVMDTSTDNHGTGNTVTGNAVGQISQPAGNTIG